MPGAGDADRPVRIAGSGVIEGIVESRHGNGDCHGLLQMWGGITAVLTGACGGEETTTIHPLAVRVREADGSPVPQVGVRIAQVQGDIEVATGATDDYGWMASDARFVRQEGIDYVVRLDPEPEEGVEVFVSWADPEQGLIVDEVFSADTLPEERRFQPVPAPE